ncbi:hypothetical protein Sfulv_57850 [Streptomyces fulvorobeus]|uniref:Amine oxidase domain-containing protein n=1 Tax=Streptomyces fulvorobeus TaxID=284028 RepID=A0A7J0CGS7_9ACTN|nr:hypothetical protein Sfulv_57850 [Streptomyces fulvorobeus]
MERAQGGFSRRSFAAAVGTATVATALTSGVTAAAPAQAAPRDSTGIDFDRCLAVARALLVLDSDDRPLVPRYQTVLKKGLPAQRRARPKNVMVIGAGPAGLVAAWLLKKAGHRVTVLEANGNRAGGRVKTFRAGGHEGAEQPFADPGQYAEAGAMRIPGSHPLVMELIDQFRLGKRRFHYVDVDSEGLPANRTWIHVNGIRVRRAEYARAPRRVNQSFGVPGHTGTPLPAPFCVPCWTRCATSSVTSTATASASTNRSRSGCRAGPAWCSVSVTGRCSASSPNTPASTNGPST